MAAYYTDPNLSTEGGPCPSRASNPLIDGAA